MLLTWGSTTVRNRPQNTRESSPPKKHEPIREVIICRRGWLLSFLLFSCSVTPVQQRYTDVNAVTLRSLLDDISFTVSRPT